ncbi:MAG: hypothetical protein P4M09_10285 [Devosia sp.]|nr:hypothetical protein [Devosia sp.]
MVTLPNPFKGPLRITLALALLSAMLIAGSPAFSASKHVLQTEQSDGSGSTDGANLMGQPACPDGTARRAGQNGRGAFCPNDFGASPGSGKTTHRLGPSAFGLQFDSGDY